MAWLNIDQVKIDRIDENHSGVNFWHAIPKVMASFLNGPLLDSLDDILVNAFVGLEAWSGESVSVTKCRNPQKPPSCLYEPPPIPP